VAGRYGGEEFIVIMPDTGAGGAEIPARRLAEHLAKVRFTSNDGASFSVTLSIGISQYHPDDANEEAIVHRADQALYHAKHSGRNRIVVYEKELDTAGSTKINPTKSS
jgi:diguanylate cyclase (GGDEF)-like protein